MSYAGRSGVDTRKNKKKLIEGFPFSGKLSPELIVTEFFGAIDEIKIKNFNGGKQK